MNTRKDSSIFFLQNKPRTVLYSLFISLQFYIPCLFLYSFIFLVYFSTVLYSLFISLQFILKKYFNYSTVVRDI
uniref:Uncharacterized protein n=1 Tax=Lepeophtheirus salmonis TaxID=72036 RepID=A0A0K2T354_LEPSM